MFGQLSDESIVFYWIIKTTLENCRLLCSEVFSNFLVFFRNCCSNFLSRKFIFSRISAIKRHSNDSLTSCWIGAVKLTKRGSCSLLVGLSYSCLVMIISMLSSSDINETSNIFLSFFLSSRMMVVHFFERNNNWKD